MLSTYMDADLALLLLLLFFMDIDKKTEYDVKVSGVEISPYPVARGQPATFSIAATAGTTN